jgi:DNA polymerase III subunit beta
MKLHCHRPSLAAAFQVVHGVVPSRTPKEILKNVKLQAADGAATLIGTDQEVGIRYEIPGVEIGSGGETLLPTNRVISILRELTDDVVNLEVTEEAVWIRSGHSEFRLSAEDPAEFPTVAAFDEKRYHVVPGSALREAIRRTIFATDVESTRYALGGVLLELQGEVATLVATDSRRLALVKSVCRSQGVEEPENTGPVVPSKAMSLIERSISEDDEEVLVAVHANDVLVKCGNSTIYSRLVEGRFPRYRDVIPNQANAKIELLVAPFYSAVRQAQIVTNEESRGVDFQFAPGLLTLMSQAADIGQSKVEMPIAYDGSELTITFDPRFVADFLRVLEPEDQVRLDLIDPESAAVFRAGDDYTYVIMPLSRDRR